MTNLNQSRMLPYDVQLANEYRFSRHHIDKYIRDAILGDPSGVAKVEEGVQLLQEWLSQTYYPSKMARLEQLKGLDLFKLVTDIYVVLGYVQQPELFTSVTAKLVGVLRFNERKEGLTTIAEMLAVLCQTDVFDILKPHPMASMTIQSRMVLSDELKDYIDNASFLPPMVCPPKIVTSNHQSGYLTHNESLILGKGNHHDGDICLDVINNQNQIPLKLDIDFLKSVDSTDKHITVEWVTKKAAEKGKILTESQAIEEVRLQKEQWTVFKKQSYNFFTMLVKQGNQFYLTNRVDKRGRLYACGFHVNSQGSPFQKASIEFAEEEIVEGV